MEIVLLTSILINAAKYWFVGRTVEDRIRKIENAKNKSLLEKYVNDDKN
jgi:hypothetical protein